MTELALRVHQLTKSLRGPEGLTPIVDVASFEVAAGEQVVLQGASGAGKTTFLHVVAGILRADGGEVTVAGEAMTGRGEAARDLLRARRIGYVFQELHLLPGYTALENVVLGMTFGPGPDRGRARELLERVGLGDRLHHRPRQLSVGQRQRVALARAVANRPALILADEPTGSLDPQTSAAALALLQEVATEAEAALVCVSHDPAVWERFARCEDFVALNRAAQEV